MFKRRKPDEPSAPEPPQSGDQGMLIPPTPGPAPKPVDTGLGVPPYRPAPPKEPLNMSRPPFPAAPMPQQPTQPPPRPATMPGRPAGRDPNDRRTLIVGRGISVQGTVQDAERLVVEGTVEASMIHANELSVALGGVFKGEIEVEDAEVAGTVDGTLTARGNLIVRATGKLLGVARCRRLQVEDGGQITGRIEMITEPRPAESPRGSEPTF